ncbi:DegT/DnrJ/EryC1/StrS family aminotransferase [Prochlorococcus marinus]|uniref:DegT/DnrJ/EryC1/StrS family aminotransferase n=1 Tax=Prochlorococcus marinus XMU1408 TaxID=2213228 RepID=A0A318R2J6_PROMR|nr:DegT/DnrJ/EryC1/StrS family aminotransferase [Prochlorococcus marinus]MBW3041342.1 DegT/DnrJ/EryC1/StrS family aminotransferase [Prochlorococcus marinus str. XMU1408]PYE02514.1 DegT/DnrJ/EryC1/StrS family aminotransferase [Prochlorococcus marinus XMU1408]
MQIPPFSLEAQISEIGEEIEEALIKVFRSGKYIGGEEVASFEKAFALAIETSYSVSCNSGTDALILALRSLNIGQGDEVITSSFSFFATAEAITSVGARPVFVDIDPENYLMDLGLIENAITSRTKAILPVHLFGHPLDMDKVMAIAKENNLKVVEDCAQAAGAHWRGKPVGSYGDVGCFSFFPTKNLGAAGDGGAITTNDFDLAKIIRELALHGSPKRYFHTNIGYNSRLDSLQAAILNVKLNRLNKWIEQRKTIAINYINNLSMIEGIKLPSNTLINKSGHSWNQFVIRIIDNSFFENIESASENVCKNSNRDLFKTELYRLGVNTIIYYPIPIHLQPAYKDLGYQEGSLPITEKICSQVISLPIFPEFKSIQQSYVIDKIKEIFRK